MAIKKAVVSIDDGHFTVYGDGKLLISVPACVVRKKSAAPSPVAFAAEAVAMKRNLPDDLMFSRPFAGSVIGDVPGAKCIVRYYLKKLFGYNYSVELYVLVSSGIPEVERAKIEQCFITCGYKNIFIVDRPYLLAKIAEKKGFNFVVFMEEDRVEVALCEGGKVQQAHSIDAGLKNVNKEITEEICAANELSPCINEVKTVGERSFALDFSGEVPVLTCFSLSRVDYTPVRVTGQDVISGDNKSVMITAKDMLPFVRKPFDKTAELLKALFMSCTEQMVVSTSKKGVLYLGGPTKINFFYEFMLEKTGMPVYTENNAFMQVKMLYELLGDNEFLSASLGF